mmetsp:Transcript_35978/g.67132  ORF Transcript_35978/g.67132 Transcript_35978/m.67132 type:complete len:116 (+) Transcript_35978:198-545(+)
MQRATRAAPSIKHVACPCTCSKRQICMGALACIKSICARLSDCSSSSGLLLGFSSVCFSSSPQLLDDEHDADAYKSDKKNILAYQESPWREVDFGRNGVEKRLYRLHLCGEIKLG